MKQGKIWGVTSAIIQNPFVEVHRLLIKPQFRCSIHKHKYKWNGFYIEQGYLDIHVWKENNFEDITYLEPGEFISVKPGYFHYFANNSTFLECLAFEIYWPEILSEDIERQDTGRHI